MRDHLARNDDVGNCARLFREVDARIDRAQVRDAQTPRVAGFPYLRVDRFTASLRDQALALRAFGPWTELLAGLDRAAREAEIANAADVELPPAAALDACRYQLAVADSRAVDALPRLGAAARVPDDYSLALRTLGLYPLMRVAFAAGIRAWHAETLAVFAAPVDALPTHGELLRYAPGAFEAAAPQAPRNVVFGLPLRSTVEWRELLERHAPALVVDTASDDDRIGRLQWEGDGDAVRVAVDTRAPAAYARIAFTQIDGRVHAQLVYTFWFPARPAAGALDVLAGALDGIVWRVTLDRDGAALVYDTIHPCGCYHVFFPTERVRARPQPDSLDEGLFTPQSVRAPRAGEGVELRVAARSHYLQRISVAGAKVPGTIAYALRDEDELRRLPLGDGRGSERAPRSAAGGTTRSAGGEATRSAGGEATRSVFGPDGLIAGSERAERFFFWPMGIASAGQMRQWGRHATAFVGRRHFDDPHLFDRYFEIIR